MARKKQTLLILLGISFGTLLFVSISGVQLGMRKYIVEQLLNNTAHILIKGAERDIVKDDVAKALYGADEFVAWVKPPIGKRAEVRLENYAGWYERLTADPNVIDFVPRLAANALITNGKFTTSVGLIGTLPDRHLRTTPVAKYLKAGSFADLASGGDHIVIGSGVAEKLGVQLGQFVNVGGGRGFSRSYKVVGILHYGNEQLDQSIAYAHLASVQALTRSPGRLTEIAVAIVDADRSAEVAADWQLMSKDRVQDWKAVNKVFMEMINVQDFTRYFITTVILIVAAFGIYNVLTIMINQKRREIAILRAIGYGPPRILELILYQGLLLGIVGGILGMLLGWLMCLWIGSIDFGFEIGGSNHLLVAYDYDIYAIAFGVACLSSLVSSFLPAWAASRLTPMDIIRAEQ